ncbi:MAG: PH domain-containing protein [Lachnospiraceae bacterium]|nr:PH domain-containing protein [Lachnospiraceae bacterium]
MNKYYSEIGNYDNDIENMLMPNESIIWKGVPKKSAFIINSSAKMAPIAILWLCFDGFFIGTMFASGGMSGMLWFIIPFFLFHLMPVWIWLYNIITAAGRWKNTEYAVTDKRIILRNGLIGYEYKSIYYTEIVNVSLSVGAIDQMLGVGDVHIDTNTYIGKNSSRPAILDVENPQYVFSIVQKTVMDIQSDIHYPNAMRPETNPGYQTTYTPHDN